MNLYLWLFFGIWIIGWWLNSTLSKKFNSNLIRFFVPTFFGIIFLIMWELIVLGLNINPVLYKWQGAPYPHFGSRMT